MTVPISELKIPKERLYAIQVVQSTYIPIGEHFYDSIGTTVVELERPDDAQFLRLQAIGQTNLRYRLDGETVNTNIGFQLAGGSIRTISVATNNIYIIAEGAGGEYQAQWLR